MDAPATTQGRSVPEVVRSSSHTKFQNDHTFDQLLEENAKSALGTYGIQNDDSINDRSMQDLRVSNVEESKLKIALNCKIESVYHDKFQEIRDMDGVTYEQILESMDVIKNKTKVFQAGEGAGASGSFFFFSHDNKFILKTMQADERGKLLQMIDNFADYLRERNNNSLMARIYGVFSIRTTLFAKVDVIVMQNTFSYFDKASLKYKFDLKGSMFNRWSNYQIHRAQSYLQK